MDQIIFGKLNHTRTQSGPGHFCQGKSTFGLAIVDWGPRGDAGDVWSMI